MIRLAIDGVVNEYDENQAIGLFSNMLVGFTQLLEIAITTYVLGYPLYDNREIMTHISESLRLLDIIGPQTTDPILTNGITTISHRFRSILANDQGMSLQLAQKFKKSQKEMIAIRKKGERPSWIDNLEYQDFMRKCIDDLKKILSVLEDLFLRIKEWRAELGIDAETQSEEAIVRKIQIIQNQRFF